MDLKKAVCGMFSTRVSAQKTIDMLVANGFHNTDIHILDRKKDGEHNFVHSQPMNTRFGALIGASVGFVLLGLVGFFVGMSSNNGVQLSTLTGCFLGILVGAACGALAGNGVPKVIRRRYGFYLKQGGLLLAVHTTSYDENQRAVQILKSSGGQDVSGLYTGEIWELSRQM